MKIENSEGKEDQIKIVPDLVRQYFSAYESKDRKALEELLSDDFSFHSPHDPHINKTIYFEKCWPFSERVQAFHIEKLFERDNEAFVRYECEPKDGATFRNTEYIRIAGNKIKEVEVYYGSLPKGFVAEPYSATRFLNPGGTFPR